MPLFLLESVGAVFFVVLMIAIAALVEATISGAIGAALA
jgi:hypothetical protein